MQTIRIYRLSGGFVAAFTGIPGLVETKEMQRQYPETMFLWVR